MKKIGLGLLFLFMALVGQAQQPAWDDVIYNILYRLSEYQDPQYKQQGLGYVDFAYVESQKTLDYAIRINDPAYVKAKTDKDLNEEGQQICKLIYQTISRAPNISFDEVIASMKNDGGKVRLCYRADENGEPVRRFIIFEADELKQNALAANNTATRNNTQPERKTYPSPEGHTYVGRANGMTITYKFVDDDRVEMTYKDGRAVSYFSGSWYQDDEYVVLSGDDIVYKINSNGSTLTDVDEGVVFKRTK